MSMITFRISTQQTGSALIISLVFLLLLTILGLSSMQSSTLQEKMAGNAAEKNRAFQLAEAALRLGELSVQDHPTNYSTGDLANLTFDTPPTAGLACDQANAWCRVEPVADAMAYYYVEKIPNSSNTYRITGLGYGRADTNRVVLQSTYRP